MNTLLLDALHSRNTSRPPLWIMRQAGRYLPEYRAIREKHSFLEMCHTPKLIVEVTRLPIDLLDFDAAILFSDILMVTEALGAPLRFEEKRGPIIDPPLKDLNELSLDHLEGRLSFLPPAIKELKRTLTIPLLGFAGAPFTLASYLIEGGSSKELIKTKLLAYNNPELFTDLLEMLEEAVIRTLNLQIASGVDAVQLFDSWAGELTEEEFINWSLKPLKRIREAVKAPLIFFSRGSSYRAKLIAKFSPGPTSIDWLRPISEVRKELPHVPLQGNLDPLLLFAPLPVLEKHVAELLESMKGDPAFIFNLGHGILPKTPVEAVKTLIQVVKQAHTIQL